MKCIYTIWLATIIPILLLCCKQKDNTKIKCESREFWIDNLSCGIKDNLYSPNAIKKINELIKLLKYKNGAIPPTILECSLHKNRSGTQYGLVILYYDEKHVVSGFHVKEYIDNNYISIEEQYTIYPGGRQDGPWIDEIAIQIHPRENNELKNNQLWERYIQGDNHNRSSLPPVIISVPKDEKRVFISLIDINGNESDEIELMDQARE